MNIRTIALLTLLAASCSGADEVYEHYVNDVQTTGAGSDEETDAATTDNSPFLTTSTAQPGTSSGGTGDSATPTDDSGAPTGEPVDAPPEIYALTVSPTKRTEAGPVLVTLEHSDNASVVTLHAEAEIAGEAKTVPLASGSPDTITWPVEFAITSQEGFDGEWTIRAHVANEYGEDQASAALIVELPEGGLEVWSREVEGPGSFMFGRGVAVHPDGAAVLVQRDLIGGSQGLVRLHNALTGEIVWESELLHNFDPRGVAVFDDGRILVVGTDLDLSQARTFTLDPTEGGAPVESWTAGTSGSEARAVSIAVDGSYAIAGVEHKGGVDNVAVWTFFAGSMPGIVRWFGPDPGEPNDEAGRAVFLNEERLLVSGVATLKDSNFDRPRMFLLEYSRALALQRWWGHVGLGGFASSESHGVAGDGDEGAVVVGALHIHDNAPPAMQIVHVTGHEEGFTEVELPLAGLSGTAAAVALDPGRRAVVAMTNGAMDPTALDVAALSLQPPGVRWKEGYTHEQSEAVEASAVAVDPYGFVYYLGSVYRGGDVVVVVGKRRP